MNAWMNELPLTDIYDVIVVGGGSAGCMAAIQAARAGARTALIEKNGVLGGTTVVAAVNFPGLFHAWEKQVIAGIGWESIERTVAKGGAKLPDFSIPYGHQHWLHQVLVNRFVYSAVLDEMCLEAGVSLRFHEMPVGVSTARSVHEPELSRLILAGKSGLSAVGFKKIVDATGDANVTGLMDLPREMGEVRQPGTLIYQIGGYDYEKVDLEQVKEMANQALVNGKILPSDYTHSDMPFRAELRNKGGNLMHVLGIDGSTSVSKSQAEIKARQAVMRIYTFLRTVPGCENLVVENFAGEVGIRETWRIVGERRIDLHSYVSAKVWPDAICYSFYPIDVHHPEGKATDTRPLSRGLVPTIPFGALIPRNSDHLLAAGRCISGDQEANSAYRVQASCMATGQAAGAGAAIAARKGISVREVDVEDVRALLRQHKAIVP
jgi:Succinate dehydrogenase/fumarate reductase, flavoprotein subunit